MSTETATPWILAPLVGVAIMMAMRPTPEDLDDQPEDAAMIAEIVPSGVDVPELADPTLRARERELDHAADTRHLALATEQHAPPGFTPLPEHREGAFPGLPFAAVRAFTFGLAPDIGGCDLVDPHDGTLCESVVVPGATLTAAQTDRLLGMLRRPAPPQPEPRCGFDPHHGFVFYDAAGTPIAEVLVCFLCAQWAATPAASAAPSAPVALREDQVTSLGALCDELHLDGCFVREWGAVGDIAFAEAALRGHLENPVVPWHRARPDIALPLTLDRGLALDALDAAERRSLCGYWANLVVDPDRDAYRTATCDDGRRITLGTYRTCVDHPGLTGTVADAENCARGLIDDPCAERAREACGKLGAWPLGAQIE